MLGFDALGRRALGQFSDATASAVTAATGTYALSFQTVNSQVSMAAATGTLSLSFQTAAGNISMPAAQGTYTLTGQPVTLTANLYLTASPFIITERAQFGFAALGQVALGEYSSSTRPTFQLQLQDAVSRLSMPAAQGTFTLSGQNVVLFLGSILTAVRGTYTLSGQNINVLISMPAAQGAYALSFVTADGVIRLPKKIRAFPRVGHAAFSAKSVGRDIKIRSYGG